MKEEDARPMDATPQEYGRLHRLIYEYVDLQYPDDGTREAMSGQDAQRRGELARGRAVQIADLVIQTGLHRLVRDHAARQPSTVDGPDDTDGM
jgi:hypothetical protein